MFVFVLTTKERLEYHIKLLLLLIFCNTAVDFRLDGTNLLTHYSNNMGKLCVTCREADEGELGSRNLYRK